MWRTDYGDWALSCYMGSLGCLIVPPAHSPGPRPLETCGVPPWSGLSTGLAPEPDP